MNKPHTVKFVEPESIEKYPVGAAYKSGHLVEKNSGWRTFRPIIDHDKCSGCRLCFIFCPDGVIDISGESLEIDYDFCKGCGICAYECRRNAISMEKEE